MASNLLSTTDFPSRSPLVLTQLAYPEGSIEPHFTLSLTAEERTRTRHRFTTDSGETVFLRLSRGTILHGGDWLQPETQDCWVRVVAKPEPVLTVTASNALDLLRAAYHLGNRHVPLEIALNYLRLSPDTVLEGMLMQLNVKVRKENAPFQPESGAYGHQHLQ
ncbi:MAG: urease accessory protein UreE [Cyanobacteria bacterium SBC]|nr:urease accessory protein UreE [Cyanobacteria bacterium SBC]